MFDLPYLMIVKSQASYKSVQTVMMYFVQHMQEYDFRPVIVAISGYDDFSYAVEMLRNGVREYILKPVEREKIWKVTRIVEKELGERQLMQ